MGTTSNFVVTDDLPAGLRYTGSPIAITTPSADFTATNSPSTSPGAGTDPLVFDFGNVTNSAAVTQTITIAYEVQVENVLGNQNLTALTNTASLSFTDASPSITDTATVTVVEPNLLISKSITSGAAGSDAGDTIGYQVAIQNSSAVGTAYQVDLRDVLPAGLLGAPDGSGTGPFFTNIGVTNPGDAVVLNATTTPLDAAAATFATTTLTDDTLTWPLFDLPPNTTLTITYDAVVTNTAPAGAMLVNDVSAAYHSLEDGAAAGRDGSNGGDDDIDDVLNNYNETDSVTLNLSTDIEIQKGLNSAQPSNDFTIGDLVTFDLRVDLIEGVTGNVVVTDVLPAGLSFEGAIRIVATPNISYTGAGTAVEAPAGTLTVDLGDITNLADDNTGNDFLVIEVDARVIDVIDNEAGDTITNSASLTSDLGPAGPDTVDIDIVEPVLAVTKVPNNAVPALGETVTWTVTVQHQPSSGADAFDVLLADVIPAGLTYVPGSHAGDGAVDETDPGEPAFDLGSITLVDTSKTFTFDTRVDLDATVGSPITNAIDLDWDGQSGAPTVERSYRVSGSGDVTPATPALIDAKKTVAIAVDGGTSNVVDPGDTLEYTVTLTNTGPAVTNAVFTDTLPTQTTYVANSLTSSQGTIDDSAAPDLSVDLGALAESATVTITFRVTVNGGTPEGTIISNQGEVDSDQTVPEPTDADGFDANGDQPTTIPVGGASPVTDALYALKGVDLIADNDASGSVTPNDTLEYFFVLVNEGPETLTGVTLSDTLPNGLTYVAASAGVSPASGSVNVTGASVVASFPSIAVGGTALISLQVTVDDPLVNFNGGASDEIFVNQAVVDSDQTAPVLSDSNGDPSDGNQPTSIQAVDSGAGTPAIDVEKRWRQGSDLDGDGLVDPGDQIAYSIIVTNTGSAAATNLRLVDPTPANTSFVVGSSSTSQGVIVSEDPLSVNIGALDPGGFVEIGFRVTVDGGTPDGAIIANQANVTADGGINENSDDNGRDGDGINPTLTPVDTGSGSAAGTPGGLSKSLVSSSESDSSGLNAQIGEVLTYRLGVNLPVGTLREVTLIDTLPTGLRYVPGTARLARVFDTGLITSRNPGGVNDAASGVFVPLADGNELIVSGNVIEIFLGDVINSDNDINDEQISLQVDVVIENVAANQAGTTLTNLGSLSFFNQLGQAQNLAPVSVTATVVEPQLEITKSASPLAITTVGGDVEYTLVVTNPGGAFAATAYDVQVTDVLPTQAGSLTIDSITPAGGAAGITDNSAGTTLNLTVAELPVNGSVTIVYTANYPAPQAPGSVVNSVDLTWTSLPGNQGTVSATPGNPGEANGERTGSATGPNDYLDMDTALITIGGLSLDKSVVNPQPRYAIGDTIDYRVQVTIPPGVNLTGTTLSDVLDPGLEYVTGTFSLTLDAGLAITNSPTDFSRADGVPGPGEETLSVDLGTLSNTADEMRVLTLDYAAVVENLLSNQDNQGLGNSVTLSITDTGAGVPESLIDSTGITVGEPRLVLNKSLTSPTTGLDAGDSVSFEVEISNAGTTTAFGVVLSDTLPAGLENVSALTIAGATGGAQTPTLTNNGSDWQSSPFDLPVGGSLTVTFDADLAATVLPGAVIQNQVSASYSSRNGDDPNQRDGSDAGSEQDDGNLNNYNAAAVAPSFAVDDSVQIDKGFFPDPANDRYTIGEQLTYRLTVDFIEGTLADLVLVDDLPATVRFESATVSFGNLGMAADTVPTGEVAGNTVTFEFGNVTNPPNGNADDDFLTVDLRVTVLNVPANVNTAVIGNNASLTFSGPAGLEARDFDADASTPGVQPLEFTVIEPDLQVLKTVSPNAPAPGALLRYSLVLDHTAASTVDAFDLQVVDTLPAGLTYVPGSASPAPTSVAGQTLTFDIAALPLATDQTTISYQATVDADQILGAELTNTAALGYNTISGENPDERGYSAGGEASVTISYQAPDLVLSKDDGGASALPGAGVVYTLSYANEGPLLATGVVITETVPANTRFDAAASAAGWDCTPDGLPDAICTLSLGSLGSGSSGSALFGLVVDAPVPAGADNIANTAVISDDGTKGFDLNPANNSDDDTTPLIAAPDLTLVKDDGDVVTVPAGVVVYTLSYANAGNQGATGVTLTETVPENTSFEEAASTDGWVCSPDITAGSICTLPIGLVAAGSGGEASFAVRIDDPLPVSVSQVENVASIADDSSNGIDPTPDNNTNGDSTPVDNAPALTVEKVLSSAPDPIEPGSVLVYAVSVANTGNATLTNVTIIDNLITPTGGTAPCLSLASGGICTLIGEYVVTQQDIDNGSIVNTATGDSDQTAPDQDQVVVQIPQNPGIGLLKTGSLNDGSGNDLADANETVDYTIVATNTGNVTLIDVVIEDDMIELACEPALPAELSPQEQVRCTGSYLVQSSDLGQPLVNVASVTGISGRDQVTTVRDNAEVSIPTQLPISVPADNRFALFILAMGLFLIAAMRIGRPVTLAKRSKRRL
ncbi:MAG: isopeptide-forming domain-containing fimbrial protein [Wenzhouxiangella sp.]|nr:isopeptide-forming domain-containing fimbrial protein [Wenzhouxiangella sp.]